MSHEQLRPNQENPKQEETLAEMRGFDQELEEIVAEMRGFDQELAAAGHDLESLPADLSEEKRRKIEERLAMILGPIAMLLGVLAVNEGMADASQADTLFKFVMPIVGGTAVGLGTWGVGFAVFTKGLKNYIERTGAPIVDRLAELADKILPDKIIIRNKKK